LAWTLQLLIQLILKATPIRTGFYYQVMMSNFNLKLIALSLLLSYFTVLLTFSFVNKLYKSQANDKRNLLAYCAMTVGSSLWAIQFLNVLAFPVVQSAGYALKYIFLSWLSALAYALIVLNVSSKKILPLKSLATGGLLAGCSACVTFYFCVISMQIQPLIEFSVAPCLLAIVVSITITILGIMIMFWLKNYSGEFPFLTKSLFALIITLALTGIHLTFNSSINIPFNAISNTPLHFDNTLLQVTVALGLISLFLVLFIIAIFYDKFSYETFKFNIFKNENHEEMSRQALVDTLTQLPNRRALMQHLEAATRRCERNGSSLAVAFVDVDNFKQINDSFGHQIGDQVLQKIAKRLVMAVRGCDEVARIGGDEFVAIIEEVESYEDCIAVVERIVSSVRESCVIDNSELHLSVSVGVAMHPEDGNINQLINAADTAMYRAKKDGKNQFRFFDTEIATAADQLLEMQFDLKNALANDELKLHYQIKIDSITREPIGAEALLRWEHPVKGLLFPAEFMQAAERFGLSYAISDWVIEESCRTLQQLKHLNIPFNVAINVSHQQIVNVSLVNKITDTLHRYELPTSSLIVEVTESAALRNQTLFSHQLSRFKEANIKVTLDDFCI
jgi:diguanylate cyclase (GGDEF)-like protein